MALPGEYAPSTVQWVRDEVEHYERTGGTAFKDRPVVLLITRGARTGLLRKTPLMRVEHRGVYAVVASMAGSDRHPAWYYNLLADPSVELHDGGILHNLVAREITGKERAGWWSRANAVFSSYADYQSATPRTIPVFVLEPASE